jgi:hypothetical protein
LGSEPDTAVTLEILNGLGKTVRTIEDVSADPGINRVWWDLKFDPTEPVKMRTSPRYAPWVTLGDSGWRAAPDVGRISVMAPPGNYTVRLTVGEQHYTQPIQVVKDPNSRGTEAEIVAQTEILHELHDNLNSVVSMINSVELVRSQLLALKRTLTAHEDGETVIAAASDLDEKLLDFEQNLTNLKHTGRGQDTIRWPIMLGGQLRYLAGRIAESDFAPTQPMLDVHEVLTTELRAHERRFEELIDIEIAEFNRLLDARGAQGVVVP